MKWVCLHCTVAVLHVNWTILSHNFSLKVEFLFQSFLVLIHFITTVLTLKETKYVALSPPIKDEAGWASSTVQTVVLLRNDRDFPSHIRCQIMPKIYKYLLTCRRCCCIFKEKRIEETGFLFWVHLFHRFNILW